MDTGRFGHISVSTWSAGISPHFHTAILVTLYIHCIHTGCTCMYGWEQLHRVWPRTKHLPPSVVTHREGPKLDGPCTVSGEPSGHAGWTTLRHWSDVLTGNLPLNGRRAETKTETYKIQFFFMNTQLSWTFLLVPCFRGEYRAVATTAVGQSERTAPSRLSVALYLTPPTSAQTSRFPAPGTHSSQLSRHSIQWESWGPI